MIAALILGCALIALLVLREVARSREGDAAAPTTLAPRFSGRLVAPPPAPRPAPTRRKARLRNGVRVSAVRNGHAVTPPDAIGLGCLAPISECKLGDRCICLNEKERRNGGYL